MALKKKTFDLSEIKGKYSTSAKYKPENFYSCGDAFYKACGIPGPIQCHVNMFLGHSNSSKTTALISAAAHAQSLGHLPVMIITERKWSWKHAVELGFKAEMNADGEWDGDFIFNDSFEYIEQVTDFINKIINEQEKGNLPYNLLFCWDSIGSIPSKQTYEGAGGTMHNARVFSDKIGQGLSARITKSKKEDYPYSNTMIIINQPWVSMPDNPFEQPEIKAKGGEAVWLASSLVFLFGKQKKAGINHISATKGGRKVVYATRTKVSVIKNHVNGMGYQDGKIIVTPQGYIEDTKQALEEYKKKYSEYWNSILTGDGEITFQEDVNDLSEYSDEVSNEDMSESMFDGN